MTELNGLKWEPLLLINSCEAEPPTNVLEELDSRTKRQQSSRTGERSEFSTPDRFGRGRSDFSGDDLNQFNG